MHFDDRLATVLRLPVRGTAIARIQYRQLLDILGSVSGTPSSDAIETAYERLDQLSTGIRPEERAGMLRSPVARLRNPRLVAFLAQDDPGVATAAIAAANLPESEWLALIPALPVRARGILRHRRDLGPRVEALLERLGITDRGLPPCTTVAADNEETVLELAVEQTVSEPAPPAPPLLKVVPPVPPPTSAPSDDGIGALVRRIEEFRRAREHAEVVPDSGDAPRLPLEDGAHPFAPRLSAFDFTTDAAGRVNWADPFAAPMVVGLRLAAIDGNPPSPATSALATALRHRQPLRDAMLDIVGAPAIAGNWQVDALPRFDPASGRFTGYSGRFRRPATLDGQLVQPAPSNEADRMRQILHELRTPANAIQVAAEIILQQLFGPTPHEYRALASAIVGDAAQVFAGFDELDRLVKLDTGAVALDRGVSDVGEILSGTVARLRAWTDPRRSGFDLSLDQGGFAIRIDPAEAERLFWRLFAALAGAAGPDEILPLSVTSQDGTVNVTVTLPASLAKLGAADLFSGGPSGQTSALSAGMFGLGFTLRLCEAEAKAAGGSLKRYDNELRLTLPGLTVEAMGHSQD